MPPFGGEIRDGRVIGRGAADMKGELAARVVAFAELGRERRAARLGDVVLVAEADEERNTADVGMSWLVREREDLRCDYALNEGGGTLLELADGRRVVTISIGEKQVDLACGCGSSGAPATRRSRRAPTTSSAAPRGAVQRLLDHRAPATADPGDRRGARRDRSAGIGDRARRSPGPPPSTPCSPGWSRR